MAKRRKPRIKFPDMGALESARYAANDIASAIHDPLANMSWGYGDYLAHEDARAKYGLAGQAFKRGDYGQAALHGISGFTDDLTTIPAVSEVAGIGKLFPGFVLAARGSRLSKKFKRRERAARKAGAIIDNDVIVSSWLSKGKFDERIPLHSKWRGNKGKELKKELTDMALKKYQSGLHRPGSTLKATAYDDIPYVIKDILKQKSPEDMLDTIHQIRNQTSNDLVKVSIMDIADTPTARMAKERNNMIDNILNKFEERILSRNPQFAELYSQYGYPARQARSIEEQIAKAKGKAAEGMNVATVQGHDTNWKFPDPYTDEQFEKIRDHLASLPRTIEGKTAVYKSLMDFEGPKTPHRILAKLADEAEKVPEELYADFARAPDLMREKGLPQVVDVGDLKNAPDDRIQKFGGENPRIEMTTNKDSIFSDYRKPRTIEEMRQTPSGTNVRVGDVVNYAGDRIKITNSDDVNGIPYFEVEYLDKGGYGMIRQQRVKDGFKKADQNSIFDGYRQPMSREAANIEADKMLTINNAARRKWEEMGWDMKNFEPPSGPEPQTGSIFEGGPDPYSIEEARRAADNRLRDTGIAREHGRTDFLEQPYKYTDSVFPDINKEKWGDYGFKSDTSRMNAIRGDAELGGMLGSAYEAPKAYGTPTPGLARMEDLEIAKAVWNRMPEHLKTTENMNAILENPKMWSMYANDEVRVPLNEWEQIFKKTQPTRDIYDGFIKQIK